jgi:hypothetical protein
VGDKVKFRDFLEERNSVITTWGPTIISLVITAAGCKYDNETVHKICLTIIALIILYNLFITIIKFNTYKEQKEPKSVNNGETAFANGLEATSTLAFDSKKDGKKKQIIIASVAVLINIILFVFSMSQLKSSSISHDADSYEASSTFASTSEFDTSFASPSILNTGTGVKVAPISSAPLSVQAIDPINNSIGETEILQINDSIYENNSYNDYPFSPAVSGTYRFEFSNVPDGTDFTLYILNSAGERKEYASYCDNGSGITTSLSSKKNYTIRVAQQCETGSYTLNIGQQKETSDISSYTAVSDSIQYTDQKNNYSFSPQSDGLYRFEFSDVPDGTDYELYVYNSGWEELERVIDVDNNGGISINLSSKKTYYISVVQYRSTGSYTLNIGHKKSLVTATGYTAISDSIQYTDQENDYSFIPSVSGTHRFEFSNVPNGTDLRLIIYNSGWEEKARIYDADNGDGITISLTKGKTYYIRVKHYRGNGAYTLNIGHKKAIANLSESAYDSDSIQYTDQENDYCFIPSVNAEYKFSFIHVPDGTDFNLLVFNSGWEEIKRGYDMDNEGELSVQLSAGETYYVRVAYYRGTGSYGIKVSR